MPTLRPLRLCFALVALLASAPAWAQAEPGTDDRARELYENGEILYNEGRYEDAIVAWEEAYRLSNRPALLFNIANAYERLGRYDEALDALNRYRAYAKAEERDSLDRRIANLERRRDEARAAAASAAPTPTPPPVEPTPAPVAPAPAPAAGGLRPAPVALAGVGVVGLGVGTVFGLQARSARAELATLCVGGDEGPICPDSAAPLLAQDQRSALLADVSFGVGAVALAGGLTLQLLGRDERVALGTTGTGLVLTTRF